MKQRTAELELLVPTDGAEAREVRELQSALSAVTSANGGFVEALEKKIFTPDVPTMAFNEVFSAGTNALQAMQEFASAGTKVLATRLEADLQDARRARTVATIVAACPLAVRGGDRVADRAQDHPKHARDGVGAGAYRRRSARE